jgi:hypothetical protein
MTFPAALCRPVVMTIVYGHDNPVPAFYHQSEMDYVKAAFLDSGHATKPRSVHEP